MRGPLAAASAGIVSSGSSVLAVAALTPDDHT